MSKYISLNLSEIKYEGDSIGRDIQVEIKILGATLKIDKRINRGEIKEVNQNIGFFKIDEKLLETDISITVIEKDWLFNDTGKVNEILKTETSKSLPQKFEYVVRVKEKRNVFWKKTAVFTITIVLEPGKNNLYELIKYKENFSEDYNRYDTIILEVTRYWNDQFLKDNDPPEELLDPNLVKAICYQESRIGNDPDNNGLINIMQVGNPGDPSVKTLRGELPEYWLYNGKEILLKYDAKVKAVRDSVYWGVRWLYHKAQYIGVDGKRHWHDWKKAVYKYGPGEKLYTENVWDIYTKGTRKEGKNKIILWTLLILLAFTVSSIIYWGNIKIAYIKHLTINNFHNEQRPADSVTVKFSDFRPSLFYAILESTRDWSESLHIGIWKRSGIKWLKFKNPPTENSILSAKFITLSGIPDPVLEVYGETHMGNGKIYLYRIQEQELSLIFKTVAVDYYNNNIWRPGGYPKYGDYSTCGEVYKGGKLMATYKDLNNDGVSDIILSGQTEIICEKEESLDPLITTEIKAAEIPVRLAYFINQNPN